jgi:hypothetical protein
VAVVTDNPEAAAKYDFEHIISTVPDTGGSRYFADYNANVTWHNAGRITAYELSPFDQTLVLDADYVIASDRLLEVLALPQQFAAFKDGFDPSSTTNLDTFGAYNMPMWWATVMMFRRGNISQYIFDSMQMIRNNWNHYKDLYGMGRTVYRNDFALSIALGIVNGHTLNHVDIPWGMATATHNQKLTQIDTDRYRVDFVSQDGKPKWIELAQDFHAMGKAQLGEIIVNHS